MMVGKTDDSAGARGENVKELQGAMLAVHFVTGQVERLAARTIWNAKPKDRAKVINCIMVALAKCQTQIEYCGGEKGSGGPGKGGGDRGGDKGGGNKGGGSAPACPKGTHEEFDICVPDLPDEPTES